MEFQQLLQQITPEVHLNLRRAVETGRWPDGRRLEEGQRELCLQAVIAYEMQHLAEQERVGFIDRGPKAEGERCGDTGTVAAEPLSWR